MHNCPQCNTPFEKGEKVCSNCSYNLEQQFICDPICPVCGTLYEAGTKRCKFDDNLLIGYKDFTVKCVRCGAVYPPETKLCPVDGSSARPKVGEYKSGSDSNYNKYGQYSKIEGYVYPKASLGPRYISLNIDGLIALLFFLSIFLGVYIIGSTYYNEDNENVLLLALGILQWTMPLIYFFIKDGFGSGQSIGKKSCRVMVVDLKTNKPCSKGKSALRNLFLFLPYFIIVEHIMVLANHKGQRLGDLVCDTQVIETWHYAPELNNTAETAKRM